MDPFVCYKADCSPYFESEKWSFRVTAEGMPLPVAVLKNQRRYVSVHEETRAYLRTATWIHRFFLKLNLPRGS